MSRSAAFAVLACFLCSGAAFAQDESHAVRGVLTAPAKAAISTDVIAPVSKVAVREGQTFTQGEVLIELDCTREQAELNAAVARLNASYVELKQKKYLLKHGATGRSEVDLANAAAVQAAAEADALKARMRGCVITAPFPGRVATIAVNESEVPQGGTPMIEIIDDSLIEIELVVPSLWLRHVRNGTRFAFTIEETGAEVQASVERVGATVDPVSQTVKLYGGFVGDAGLALAGMSGTAVFDIEGLPDSGIVTGAMR